MALLYNRIPINVEGKNKKDNHPSVNTTVLGCKRNQLMDAAISGQESGVKQGLHHLETPPRYLLTTKGKTVISQVENLADST